MPFRKRPSAPWSATYMKKNLCRKATPCGKDGREEADDLLTPHIAGVSPKYLQRAMEIIEHNLKVYSSQVGEMMNVVDFSKGY